MNDATTRWMTRLDEIAAPDLWEEIERRADERSLAGGVEYVSPVANGGEAGRDPVPHQRGVQLVAAAALVLVAIVGWRLVASDGSSVEAVRQPDASTTVPAVDEIDDPSVSLTATDAVVLVDRFMEASIGGDEAELAALFAPVENPVDEFARDRSIAAAVWNSSAGFRVVNRECHVEELGVERFEVTCRLDYQQDLRAAVGAPWLPFEAFARVGPEGLEPTVSFRAVGFGGAGDGSDVDEPFRRWMAANHPTEVEATVCCPGADIDEARAMGKARRSFGEQWVAFLAETNCRYDQPCASAAVGDS